LSTFSLSVSDRFIGGKGDSILNKEKDASIFSFCKAEMEENGKWREFVIFFFSCMKGIKLSLLSLTRTHFTIVELSLSSSLLYSTNGLSHSISEKDGK